MAKKNKTPTKIISLPVGPGSGFPSNSGDILTKDDFLLLNKNTNFLQVLGNFNDLTVDNAPPPVKIGRAHV